MNDKELLELAAKAAGIELDWDMPERCKSPWIIDSSTQWNPLIDDGDALRLAVKLGLQLLPYPIYKNPKFACIAQIASLDADNEREISEIEKYGDDPYAATRRAIVRAAAELERTL